MVQLTEIMEEKKLKWRKDDKSRNLKRKKSEWRWSWRLMCAFGCVAKIMCNKTLKCIYSYKDSKQ